MIVTKEMLARRLEDGRWAPASPSAFRWFGNDPRYEVQFKERFKQWAPATEPATRPATLCRIRLKEPSPVRTAEPFTVRHYFGDSSPTLKGNGFDGLKIGETREEAERFVEWLNERLPK